MTATLYPTRRADRTDNRRHAPARDVDGVDYTARRLAAGAVAVLAVVVLASAGSALFGALADAAPASASDNAATVGVSAPTVHVAQPGDTLWSIADQYRGPVAHGRYVDVLVDLNGGAVVQIGQAVRLP